MSMPPPGSTTVPLPSTTPQLPPITGQPVRDGSLKPFDMTAIAANVPAVPTHTVGQTGGDQRGKDAIELCSFAMAAYKVSCFHGSSLILLDMPRGLTGHWRKSAWKKL